MVRWLGILFGRSRPSPQLRLVVADVQLHTSDDPTTWRCACLKSGKLLVWGMKAASSRMMRRRECPTDIVGRCLELDQKQETTKSCASIESRLCLLPLSQAEPNDAPSEATRELRAEV
jgi:hypothetical protein